MPYPNTLLWSALQDGKRISVDGGEYVLSVVDCGFLTAPVGHLVVCDPFAMLQPSGNLFVPIIPGCYPVQVTLADVSGEGNGSHTREAYATLILSDAPEVIRRIITPLADGRAAPPEMENGSYYGFGVNAGTACFVDGGTLPQSMPPVKDWEDVFDGGTSDSWFSRMDDPAHIRAGLANVTLPNSSVGANIILIHSGWGDGSYPVVGGFDAGGILVRVHIDFFVVPPESED